MNDGRLHMSPLESFAQRRRRYTASLHPEVVTDLYERVNSGAISIALATLIADVLGPGDWREDAACKGMDPTWWFPDGRSAPGRAQAHKICRSCPVRQQCFDYAEQAPEMEGIWGGHGTATRRRANNKSPYTAPETVCIDCGVSLNSRQRVRCDDCSQRNREQRNRAYALRRDSRELFDGYREVAS